MSGPIWTAIKRNHQDLMVFVWAVLGNSKKYLLMVFEEFHKLSQRVDFSGFQGFRHLSLVSLYKTIWRGLSCVSLLV